MILDFFATKNDYIGHLPHPWKAAALAILLTACAHATAPRLEPARLRLIIDSDANNEVDDQHAIAYALFNQAAWDVIGITTNRTLAGGDIAAHTEEARRVVKLCGFEDRVPIYPGADKGWRDIAPTLDQPSYDGQSAVEFIRTQAAAHTPQNKLVVLALGKLTNVALALRKDSRLASGMRVVWLGSNWPNDTREYNERSDVDAVNFILNSSVELDIALVRYGVEGQEGGTAAVKVSLADMREHMPGLGPEVPPVSGRHGGTFTHFGDYALNLFERSGSTQRALFDMAAVAVVKHPAWATTTAVPAPEIIAGRWQSRPHNPRTIRVLTNFQREAIIRDFFAVMAAARAPGR